MVQEENTTQSPSMILKLNILQKRDDVLRDIGNYYRSNGRKRSTKDRVISGVKILMLELRPLLIRYKDWGKIVKDNPDLDYEFVRKLVFSNNIEESIAGFELIDLVLDKKKLTKWDTYRQVDSFDMEAENRANHV